MKKILSLLGLVTLLVTTLVTAFIPSSFALDMPGNTTSPNFSDVSTDYPYADAIYYLKDKGIVSGFNDGTFKPDATVTRAEFLRIVMDASKYAADVAKYEVAKDDGGKCFGDVGNEWFAKYACTAKTLKLVAGFKSGLFKPNTEIGFAEASTMIANILDLKKDDSLNENWYQSSVKVLENINAIPAPISNFDYKLTRAEMADLIYRIDSKDYYKISNTYDGLKNGEPAKMSLKTFSSCDDMRSYMNTFVDNSDYNYLLYPDEEMAEPSDRPAATPSTKESATTSGAGVSHSTTNIQVAGVDEADSVKNDGKYIYALKGDTVEIVTAYPPSSMALASTVTFDDADFSPYELYVDGNTMVVLGTSYVNNWGPLYYNKDGGAAYELPLNYSSKAEVYFYDITDRTNVKLTRQLSFEGDYTNSRLVLGSSKGSSNRDTLYVVSNKYADYWTWKKDMTDEELVPSFADSSNKKVDTVASCSAVRYIPGSRTNDFIMVSAIPLLEHANSPGGTGDVTTEVVVGDSGQMYASQNNLYLIEESSSPIRYDFRRGWEAESMIHKFTLGNGTATYAGSGLIAGRVLNQFSMDEQDGYFRIATTEGWSSWSAGADSSNNLYVLDGNLNTVGKLEGLAPGEQIYSVRFLGDRGYISTFKSIDPLFVVDLKDVTSPKVLGQLKLPGVSDYLHPYDENHIIGFGLQTKELTPEEVKTMGSNFAWYQGIKMVMFDVTDVTSPKALHEIVIGDRGTTSELLYNHKALLFDKEKGIIAFPITVAKISDSVKNDPNTPAWYQYGDAVSQGAQIYNVSVADGFTLRGTITHYNDFANEYAKYYDNSQSVSRIMYIGNYFYTVSNYKVMANNISDLAKVKDVLLK